MGIRYQDDIAGWASEQAALLRNGQLLDIDVLNIAEEIDSVGRAERRELKSRMSVLLAHLLKWKFQPARRGASWAGTIDLQRGEIADALDESPSLRRLLDDPRWLRSVWRNGAAMAHADTGLDLPPDWLWTVGQVLDPAFLPG